MNPPEDTHNGTHTPPPPGLPPLRILHIEDNPADVLLLRKILDRSTTARYHIENVPTIKQAIPLIGQGHSMVLLDLDLPDTRGLETLRTLRAHHPRIPVLVVTGHVERSIGLQALGAGAQGHLVKDEVSLDVLERRITHTLERARIQQRIAPPKPHGELKVRLEKQRTPGKALWAACRRMAREKPLVFVAIRHDHQDVTDRLGRHGIEGPMLYIIDATGTRRPPLGRALDHISVPGPEALEEIAMATEDGCRLRGPGCTVIIDSLDILLDANEERHVRDFLTLLSHRLHSLGVDGVAFIQNAHAMRNLDPSTRLLPPQ